MLDLPLAITIANRESFIIGPPFSVSINEAKGGPEALVEFKVTRVIGAVAREYSMAIGRRRTEGEFSSLANKIWLMLWEEARHGEKQVARTKPRLEAIDGGGGVSDFLEVLSDEFNGPAIAEMLRHAHRARIAPLDTGRQDCSVVLHAQFLSSSLFLRQLRSRRAQVVVLDALRFAYGDYSEFELEEVPE
jgi:hypothetical protein